MQPIFDLTSLLFRKLVLDKAADKIAGKVIAGREAKKEAEARGEAPPPKPKINPFRNFWNLDEKKTGGQAFVTVLFFFTVVAVMDAVVFMPFRGKAEAAQVLAYVEKFPPSLLVVLALTVLVMTGRGGPLWGRALAVLAVPAIGFFLPGSVFTAIPLALLLTMPLKGEAEHAEEVAAAMEPAAPAPQEIRQESEPAAPQEQEPEPAAAAPAPAPAEYSDPLAPFLNKKK